LSEERGRVEVGEAGWRKERQGGGRRGRLEEERQGAGRRGRGRNC
jgi:hypothetical protein